MENEKNFYIYRFLDSDRNILYVGRTRDLESRLLGHFNIRDDKKFIERNKKTKFIEYVIFDKMTYSAIYEILLINIWLPPYNQQSKYNETIARDFLAIDNLAWTNIEESFLNRLIYKAHTKRRVSKFRNFSTKENILFDNLENTKNIKLKNADRVLLAILWRAYAQNIEVDTPFILKKSRLSISTIKRATNNLRAANLIKTECPRNEKLARFDNNKYYLTEGAKI